MTGSGMEFASYFTSFQDALKGKDPSRAKKQRRGSVVLVLEDEHRHRHRMTIRVAHGSVDVVEGKRELENLPTAFVFGKLDDWVAFFDRAEVVRLSSIDFYGDVGLLETIAELTAQKLTPLALRCRQPGDV